MCRRILALLVALGCLALAAAPSAQAQAPTIVTDITFPEGGEPFGTFTALDPLCPSGTFVDQFVGGGGAFRTDRIFYGASTVRKTFTCADGSGQAGPFAVIGGTGDYAQLRGRGDFCVFGFGEDDVTETFTGRFRLG